MIERETISAHEINKYDYCPYQWYYDGSTAGRSCGGFMQRETHACI